MARTDLTQARLRELLHYDQLTGVFTWLAPVGRWGRIPAGTIAGNKNKALGYVQIGIDGFMYLAHRLAWLYVHGEWPTHGVDHMDTIRDHNWIDNLRPATQSENGQNIHQARSNSSSGLLGVERARNNRWTARIGVCGRRTYLGSFDSPEKAHAAYLSAKETLHPFQTIVSNTAAD